MTTTYAHAVAAIREFSESRAAELDALATKARAEHLASLRSAATEGVPTGSPMYPVAVLLAQTITVGREDGFPEINIPAETLSVLMAAKSAGLMVSMVGKIQFFSDLSGVDGSSLHHADYTAWNAAREYRAAQKWQKL